MDFIDLVKENARKHGKKIVLPEGTEERTIKAADIVLAEGLAKITLIGNREIILESAKKFNLKNIERATIVDPMKHEKKEQYIDLMVELRKGKGLTKEDAS